MREALIDRSDENTKWCLEPSTDFYKMLEECGGDPRSVYNRFAINRIQRGWQPTWDARDARL